MFQKLATKRSADRLIEEQLYAEVAEEISSGSTRPGLWAKALANADDEKKAEGLYIKYRVQAKLDEARVVQAAEEKAKEKQFVNVQKPVVPRKEGPKDLQAMAIESQRMMKNRYTLKE